MVLRSGGIRGCRSGAVAKRSRAEPPRMEAPFIALSAVVGAGLSGLANQPARSDARMRQALTPLNHRLRVTMFKPRGGSAEQPKRSRIDAETQRSKHWRRREMPAGAGRGRRCVPQGRAQDGGASPSRPSAPPPGVAESQAARRRTI